jgi:hypothetical protein
MELDKIDVDPISIIHLRLYKFLLKVSRGEDYVDTDKMLYAMKRMFHSAPRIFYRIIMKEMIVRGFVKPISSQRYYLCRTKRLLNKAEFIPDTIFPIPVS